MTRKNQFCLGIAALTFAASGLAADDWQTLTVPGGEGVQEKKCEIKVPKGWALHPTGCRTTLFCR